MMSFLILTILVTPKKNLSIFIPVTSSSVSCQHHCLQTRQHSWSHLKPFVWPLLPPFCHNSPLKPFSINSISFSSQYHSPHFLGKSSLSTWSPALLGPLLFVSVNIHSSIHNLLPTFPCKVNRAWGHTLHKDNWNNYSCSHSKLVILCKTHLPWDALYVFSLLDKPHSCSGEIISPHRKKPKSMINLWPPYLGKETKSLYLQPSETNMNLSIIRLICR